MDNINEAETINEPVQPELEPAAEFSSEPDAEPTGIFKEAGKALKILCLNGETVSSVSQSRSAFKYGLIFMFLPNIVLFVLILLSGVYVGFAGLLVSLAQSFLIIGLSFLIAKFLFKGQGTFGGYFRPASYSFIFLGLTPLIVLVYAPLPAVASLLALFLVFFGFWNIVVLAKSLKHTQNTGIVKSLVSVLIALFVLSLGLSAPALQNTAGEPENFRPQNDTTISEEQFQQFDNELSGQDIARTPAPQPSPAPSSEKPTTWDDVNRETVMGGMTTHTMNQISNGIWSGNYYNPSIP